MTSFLTGCTHFVDILVEKKSNFKFCIEISELQDLPYEFCVSIFIFYIRKEDKSFTTNNIIHSTELNFNRHNCQQNKCSFETITSDSLIYIQGNASKIFNKIQTAFFSCSFILHQISDKTNCKRNPNSFGEKQ